MSRISVKLRYLNSLCVLRCELWAVCLDTLKSHVLLNFSWNHPWLFLIHTIWSTPGWPLCSVTWCPPWSPPVPGTEIDKSHSLVFGFFEIFVLFWLLGWFRRCKKVGKVFQCFSPPSPSSGKYSLFIFYWTLSSA